MLKAVSVCVVALSVFLNVNADRGTESPHINSYDDSSEADSSTEVIISVRRTDEPEEEEKNNVACGPPPEIEGAITPHLEGTKHIVGTSIIYHCNFGYASRSSGGFLSTCKIEEQTGKALWTNPDISCVSRSCGDPGYVVNARRIGNLFTFPNKVEFECEEGYKLRGLKAHYCQANGEWSGRLPTCELIYCSPPNDPENGRVRYSSLEYGTELRYECNNGFALKNPQPRFCTGDGTWSNNEPECIEIRCKVPDPPERGSVRLVGDPKVGSIVLYSCDDDTTMFGTSTSKCLSNGVWTFDPPKCLRSCKINGIKNGEIGRYETIRTSRYRTTQQFVKFQVGESVKPNETVIFRCKPGFTLANRPVTSKDGSDEVLCNDGSWNKPMLCQEESCVGQPPPIENGRAVVTNRSHGYVIWYSCDPDFYKEKSGNIRCEHGTWKGNTPVCGDTRCYTDQLDFPGLIKPEEKILKTKSDFEIDCERGYKKITWKKKITCSLGTWDIDRNPCDIETCDDDPPPVMNGKPSQFTREHGSVVRYECDEHFDMIGNSTVRCDAGKWEGEPPSCQESVESVETSSAISTKYTKESIIPVPLHYNKCTCAYDFDTELVTASVGNRKLEPENRIERDEVVSLSCRHNGMDLLWPNGLRLFGNVNLTCSACKDWQRSELPTCDVQQPGDSFIVYSDNMRILPGGAVEINKSESIEIRCMNFFIQPRWYPGEIRGIHFTGDPYSVVTETGAFSTYMNIYTLNDEHVGKYECFSVSGFNVYRATILDLRISEPEIRCPELRVDTNKGNFTIDYENERKVNTAAYYTCRDKTQKLIGASSRRCLENGKWSGTYPACEDTTCQKFSTYNGLVVSYTNDSKVNSIAKFRCSHRGTLVGSNSSVCQLNGVWSNPWPTCENYVTCARFKEVPGLEVSYSDDVRVRSIASFRCSPPSTLLGSSSATCRYNGTWSHPSPTCENYVTCARFKEVPGLEVSYSDDVRVRSTASFRCSPPNTLLGSSSATCRYNGIWSHPSPTCETPRCSLDTLMSALSEGVVVDMSEVNGEFVPYDTELQLLCEDNLILTGSSKATCKLRDRWEYGNVQCVPGCRLHKDASSSFLMIEPVKEYYRFGDFILLSCPPGHKLSGEVERIMCLDKSWSADLPECIEFKETSPSGLTETTRKFA